MDPMPRFPEVVSSPPVHRNLCDVFVKIGGSILDHEAATAALVSHLTDLGQRHRILILTGGGQVAKRIKANQRRLGQEFYRFWRATGLCPEVNAYLLASYSVSFCVVSCAGEIGCCFDAGKIGVLAPSGAILNSLYLLPDWEVTTDSIGLHFASLSGARRYVIVSNVHGVYDRKPAEGAAGSLIARLGIDELERLPSSKVDPGFPAYFRHFPVPTFVVNGHHPERVRAAICGDPTVGTEIVVSEPERAAAHSYQAARSAAV
jgi:5-(aminomethyl)-3-furanmethanol phosphate kinase